MIEMKKNLFRILTSLTAFLLGFSAVWILSYRTEISFNRDKETALPPKEFNDKIEARFDGFIFQEGSYFSEFTVENNTSYPVYYRSYESKEDDVVKQPIYQV